MSIYGEAIWVSGSPSLRGLSTPLINKLVKHTNISGWEYIQSVNECQPVWIQQSNYYIVI